MKLGESSNNYTLDVEIDPKSGGLRFTIEYPFQDLYGDLSSEVLVTCCGDLLELSDLVDAAYWAREKKDE